jgi:hypothetical protein
MFCFYVQSHDTVFFNRVDPFNSIIVCTAVWRIASIGAVAADQPAGHQDHFSCRS